MTGKAASAVLTFVILLWLVRLLPVAEYGTYLVLIAATELGFAIAGLGLPWLAARYVPEYRLHCDGPTLARFCWRLVFWQIIALLALATTATLALDVYLRWTGLTGQRAAAGFALLLLVAEGTGRFLYVGLMAPLMLQSWARFSLILRQVGLLVAIAVLAALGWNEAVWVLAAEAGVSILAWLVAVFAIFRHLRSRKSQPRESGWLEPRIADQWRIALRMHAAHLITLTYSPQVFLNLVQRALGTEAAALFGFLRTLYEQVARNLPSALLFTVFRPKLMASHLQGGMKAITRQVNLVGKLSLFVLLPIVMVIALEGDYLVTVLSGGKFSSGGALLVGLLLALVPFSQRQLIETVAVAAGRSGLCTLGSALGLLALPLTITMLDLGLGLWAPILAILFGQIVFNATVLVGLAKTGYRTDWTGATKLFLSALVAWVIANATVFFEGNVVRLVLAGLLASLVFLLLVWRLEAFSLDERRNLDGVLGRRLFGV
jgi:O-antigen/teichoic acid export membrane protein